MMATTTPTHQKAALPREGGGLRPVTERWCKPPEIPAFAGKQRNRSVQTPLPREGGGLRPITKRWRKPPAVPAFAGKQQGCANA